jgi:hypothetical protein
MARPTKRPANLRQSNSVPLAAPRNGERTRSGAPVWDARENLGYMVENVQKGFPDCEAKRQIGPERWQRVHIEFEFESKNFPNHGHPLAGCDVIVCWRHNWDECPEDIEILELSNVIKSLATSED